MIHTHTDLLTDFATGALPEGPALIIATQIALDVDARQHVQAVETVGGVLLEAVDPTDVSDHLLDETLDLLDMEDNRPIVMPKAFDEETMSIIPQPLQRYLPGSLGDLKWSRYGKAVEQADLHLSSGPYKATLLRIKAGEAIPRHTHKGEEYTLVLSGGFTDGNGHYARGALTVCDGSDEHSPIADMGEDCLCLTVLDAPIRMTGLLGRLFNPFLRF